MAITYADLEASVVRVMNLIGEGTTADRFLAEYLASNIEDIYDACAFGDGEDWDEEEEVDDDDDYNFGED